MYDLRWKVYRIVNHTLREIYIGVARDIGYRLDQHAGMLSGGGITIGHWRWGRDEIRPYTYRDRFNSRSRASEYAHYVERRCQIPPGYSVFLTGGI